MLIGNVSTAVQSTSTPIKPPKLSKKKGLSSLFGGNNRKKSHDLESMFPDAIPASGAQTLPPNKSQGRILVINDEINWDLTKCQYS